MRGLILSLIGCLLLSACGSPEDAETQIREWLEQGEELAEARNRRGLAAMMSPSYSDQKGNDRAAIENLLRFYFLRQDTIALITHVESIEVFGDTAAEVTMTIGMAGRNDGALGFSADAQRFAFELEQVDGDWRLMAARWADLGETL